MGTPEIAEQVFARLLEDGANIVLAVCQPDRKTGRKQKLMEPPVKKLALAHGIPVFQPEKIRADYQPIIDADADLIITCAYGQIVPEAVLQAPKMGCVNLHGSLLPEYRGAAPIQRALWDGKTESGMSLMRMERGMDTGGVAAIEKVEISPDDNSTSLFEKMGKAAGDLIVRKLPELLDGTAVFEPQDNAKATYAPMISAKEEVLNLTKSDAQILNQIRALSEHPGAYGRVNGKKMKILKAHLKDGSPKTLGLLQADGRKSMTMDLHDHLLVLEQVQLEGKPAMRIADFMNGQGRALDGSLFVGKEN